MKKLFSFCFVAVAALMISCGGNANKPAEEAQVETVPTEVVAADSTACCTDTVCCPNNDHANCKKTAPECASK